VAYSPDGQYLASASVDTTVRIWDAETGQEQPYPLEHRAPVLSVSFSRDGRWLASTTGDMSTRADGEIKVWDAQTGRGVWTLRGHTGLVFQAKFSRDGQRLASVGRVGTVRLWDLQTGQQVLMLRRHHGQVRSVDFTSDGTRLVSAGHDRTVRIWDATPVGSQTGQESFTLSLAGGVRSVAFSPDGRHFVSAGNSATVRIWDFQGALAGVANPLVQTLPGGKGNSLNVAFSKDGRLLASAGGGDPREDALIVWDASTWKELYTIPKRACPVAFSAEGQYLAAVSGYTIDLYDAATGRAIHRPLKGHNWAIFHLAFGRPSGFQHRPPV
jgi:WD40 repeat protein